MHPGKRENSDEVMAELARRISELLDRVQRSYPDAPSGPHDSWWLPNALGGTAPTPQEAAAMDAAARDRAAAAGKTPDPFA
jgi:hypothetical protein